VFYKGFVDRVVAMINAALVDGCLARSEGGRVASERRANRRRAPH
jgi:hypothetical protein